MADKHFFTTRFTEWKNGETSNPLLAMCKSLMTEELFKHQHVFYKISNATKFEEAFKLMVDDLFKYTVKLEYVLVLITFCLLLDECMTRECDWYTPEILINILCKSLCKVNFDFRILIQKPKEQNRSCYKFLTIVPLLFFCYNI